MTNVAEVIPMDLHRALRGYVPKVEAPTAKDDAIRLLAELRALLADEEETP